MPSLRLELRPAHATASNEARSYSMQYWLLEAAHHTPFHAMKNYGVFVTETEATCISADTSDNKQVELKEKDGVPKSTWSWEFVDESSEGESL